MIRTVWFAIALLAAAAWGYGAADHTLGCVTDTECAALCPADDADCDGGPQS